MNQLTVHYAGQKAGTLADARGGLVFEYDPQFIASGHELSPLNLPLGPGLRSRGPVPSAQLPGLFDDSLPDNWGRRVMLEWFRRQEVAAHAVTPLAMLAYVGARGMGALTYEPARDLEDDPAGPVSLARLHAAAVQAEAGTIDLDALAAVGSSAGGARPKALIALPGDGAGAILAGAGPVPATHEAWMVKFDLSRDATAGPMEEAFARMARAAGIAVPATRLLETKHPDGLRRHFAVKRFDRAGAERIHHHTLAALCQVGGGDLDYETLLRVTRRLTRDETEVWHAYRRAVFNVLASNRDDHGKNHGFLYHHREWKLGPAYDLTFTSPAQQPERGLALLGVRRAPDASHLLKLAEAEALDRRQAASVIEEVRVAVGRWREFAAEARVPDLKAAEVQHELTGLAAARPGRK
ncbi:MAG: type II toxin-antitoxin system HipA family toxin [bacterium]|nr:type II toxin-antitoxin system HipA family toxin [bacterium]MDI1335881.1 type II toxin-antitoxin system HipA family toxin [Lacunisphaera sp.]